MKVRQPRYKQIFETHENGAEKAEIASVCWAECIEHLSENDLLTKARVNAVDRYCRLKAEYDVSYSEATKDGPTLKSGQGGEFANMKWHSIGKLNADMLKLEASLLISPQSAGGSVADKKENKKPTAADEFLD